MLTLTTETIVLIAAVALATLFVYLEFRSDPKTPQPRDTPVGAAPVCAVCGSPACQCS